MPAGDDSQQAAKEPGCRRIENQPRLTRAIVRLLHPVRIQEARMPGTGHLHPGEQVKIEIMAARIATHDQRSNREQGSADDQKPREL